MKKVIGIDLGTTYSCIAHVNEYGVAEVLANSAGERTTPSVVWFDGERAVVGQEAKEMSPIEFDAVCSFIKRNMGSADFFFEVNGRRYSPEQVSSLILRKLVQDASAALGEEITDVVITCPAYFFVKEREATKRAGEMAGLNVLQIVNEPTAAAVAYGVRPGENDQQNGVVMVYDLGGGTFDVTLIQITPDGLDVICTDGDHQLGGKDWDDRLVYHFANRFTEETAITLDLHQSPELYQDLLHRAEQAKKQLTAKQSTIVKFSHEGETVRFDLTRETFEELTGDLIEKTMMLTRSVLDAAVKKGFSKFDKLILVGGSSRMPQVAARLEREFSVSPVVFDPDEAVAKGAAIIGNNIQLRKIVESKLRENHSFRDLTLDVAAPEEIAEAAESVAQETGYTLEIVNRAMKNVRNVTSKSFGVVTVEGGLFRMTRVVSNLIYRNTPTPAEVTERFATFEDHQETVLLELMENMFDSPDAPGMTFSVDESAKLWEGELAIARNLPANSPIDVTFKIDENGLLTLIVTDPKSGNRLVQHIQTNTTAAGHSPNDGNRSCRDLIVE